MKPQMAGMVARAAMETPEGRQRYEAQFRALFARFFDADKLTNRVNRIVAGLRPFLGRNEFKGIEREAAIVRERIVQRELDLRKQLTRPEPAALDFKDGVARLSDGRRRMNRPGKIGGRGRR